MLGNLIRALLSAAICAAALPVFAQRTVVAQSTPVNAVYNGVAGTTNPYAPVVTGPFVCETLRFVANTSLTSGLNWDFGNPESGSNTVTSVAGQEVQHQYSGFTSGNAFPSTRHVTVTSATDPSSFDSLSVVLFAPTQRFAIRNTALLYTAASFPAPVVGDQFVDASDGTIESHYGRWIIDLGPTSVVPGVGVATGGCGSHTLTDEAHYTPYNPNALVPSPSGDYVRTINTSYSVVPFTVAIQSPSPSGSTIVFSDAVRVTSDLPSLPSGPSTACNYQWALKDNSGNVKSGQSGASTLGTIPTFAVSKSSIQAGDRISLSVTVNNSALSAPCQPFGTQTALMNVSAPMIFPLSVSRTAGSPGTNSNIATVSDAEDSASALVVTATSVPAGISITNINNVNGAVTATVAASCSAQLGPNLVPLTVQDSTGLISTANLTVDVAQNTLPTLGNYADTTVQSGASASVTPSATPSDNGTVSLAVSTVSGNAGNLSVSSGSGVVSVTNANSGTYSIVITATDNCGATSTKSFTLTVLPPFGAPANLIATATSATSIRVTWNPVSGAEYYELVRTSAGSPGLIDSLDTTFTDNNVAAGTAYLYQVRAARTVNGAPAYSAYSSADLATTVIFTDDPLVSGVTRIKAVHVSQLRVAVNAIRLLAGLGAGSFTDGNLSGQPVKAIHMNELRSALSAARSALHLPAATFTNAIVAGTSVIRILDLAEFRSATQ